MPVIFWFATRSAEQPDCDTNIHASPLLWLIARRIHAIGLVCSASVYPNRPPEIKERYMVFFSLDFILKYEKSDKLKEIIILCAFLQSLDLVAPYHSMVIDIHRKHHQNCIVSLSPTVSNRMHTHRLVWMNQSDSYSLTRPAPEKLITFQKKNDWKKVQNCNHWKKKRAKFIQTSGDMYRFVPTRWFDGMSTVSVLMSCRTANPRSPIAQVRFDFTRIFFDFKSRCAIAGLPTFKIIHFN